MRNFSPRKLICLMIPIFGTVSIVGTGFSLWAYIPDDKTMQYDMQIPISVEQEVEDGSFNANSILTEGSLADARKSYIFPRILVFEEGNGLVSDLTKGLNFYKIISNTGKNKVSDVREFVDEPHLEDEVLITYYRDTTILDKDLFEHGLEFALEVEISITEKLSHFITILDKYKGVASTLGDTNPSTIYRYNFTEYAIPIGEPVQGSTIKTPLTPLKADHFYQQYDYIMNFSKVFRYTDISKKPVDKQSFWNIEQLCKPRPGQKDFVQQILGFNFFASYKEIK